jgi:hypothetical protein
VLRGSPGALTGPPPASTRRFLSVGDAPTLVLAEGEAVSDEAGTLSAVAVATTLLAGRLSSAASAWGLGSAVARTRGWMGVSGGPPAPSGSGGGLRAALAGVAAQALGGGSGGRTVAATYVAGWDDPPRAGVAVVVDPLGLTAACTDTLGRVLLIDVATFTVVRVWKGYRHAQCAWVEAVAETDSSTHSTPPPNQHQQQQQQQRQQQPQLQQRGAFLAIYAPRRGLLELWRGRQGPRVAAYAVGLGARLVPGGAALDSVPRAPATAYLVDAAGHVRVLSATLDADSPYVRHP